MPETNNSQQGRSIDDDSVRVSNEGMSDSPALTFKVASTDAEFEQIFELNYETFVEEIPQHPANTNRRLVDRFHAENNYLIALKADRLIGMMAVRDRRPFSLDEKLGNIDSYLPPGRSLCEIRLLSVRPEHRNGTVLQGLLKLLLEFGRKHRYNLAVISGTVRQRRLYRHLGFTPFGPLVGTPEAQYQPMFLRIEEFEENAQSVLDDPKTAEQVFRPVSFLPGPVSLRPEVRAALQRPPISHRSPRFAELLSTTKKQLCRLVQARFVELFVGSGTLANDVVAAQLSLLSLPGAILSSGEFGLRLVDHARRFRLSFEHLEQPWGSEFEEKPLLAFLEQRPQTRWLWATACETSTGVRADVEMLKRICRERNILLSLDAISTIGSIPVDLRDVHLASCVSGKGLAAYPGIAMVFYHHELTPQPERLPRYLDLGYYAAQGGIPFTQNSNLLGALQVALDRYEGTQPFEDISDLSYWLRPQLRELGLQILADERVAMPSVITLVLPKGVDAERIGSELESSGFLLSYQSEYLRSRNWIQICLMGNCPRACLSGLLSELRRLVGSTASVETG